LEALLSKVRIACGEKVPEKRREGREGALAAAAQTLSFPNSPGYDFGLLVSRVSLSFTPNSQFVSAEEGIKAS
jgi:hypothetical protein